MAQFLNSTWRLTLSRKLAVWLLGFLGVLVIISRFIPQHYGGNLSVYLSWKASHPFWALLFEKIGLTNIYTSWLFIFLCSALFINTTACTLQRTYNLLSARKKECSIGLDSLKASKTYFKIDLIDAEPQAAEDKITALLKKRLFRVKRLESTAGTALIAIRGRFAEWFSPLFHFALILIFLGGAITGLTRFSGILELTESQIAIEDSANYIKIFEKGPLFNNAHRSFEIKLVRFTPVYLSTGEPKNFYSTIAFSNGWERTDTDIWVSKPGSYQGVLIYQGQINGISALLSLSNTKGEPISSSFFLFDKPKEIGKPLVAKHDISDAGVSFEGRLLPNPAWRKEGSGAAWKIRNPALDLKILKDKRTLYHGRLLLGQTAEFEGYRLTFEDAKYWSSYNIVIDKGRPIIFAGFWLGLISLGLLSLLNEKRISIIIQTGDKPTIHVAGNSNKYKASFREELVSFAADLKSALGVVKE
ncbi:MAG: cytochrome c biogenesis protein ResB [Firmicutes bacterium]|nr:cytochrome c biogenesis protein ResB [Bacillota bacterium]